MANVFYNRTQKTVKYFDSLMVIHGKKERLAACLMHCSASHASDVRQGEKAIFLRRFERIEWRREVTAPSPNTVLSERFGLGEIEAFTADEPAAAGAFLDEYTSREMKLVVRHAVDRGRELCFRQFHVVLLSKSSRHS